MVDGKDRGVTVAAPMLLTRRVGAGGSAYIRGCGCVRTGAQQRLASPACALIASARGLSTDADGVTASGGPGFVGDTVRLGLEGLQAATGLPWWATLAACGAGMRLGLLPLSKVQETHISRLQTVMPALREHLQGAATDDSSNGAAGRDWGGVRAALRQARCSPLLIVGPPLLQIASFVTLTVGVRTLAMYSHGEVHDALSTGGCLWFSNLTIPDELWALPMLHVAVVLINLELGLGSVVPPPAQGTNADGAVGAETRSPGDGIRRVVGALHTGLNMTMLTVFPLISELPQAVFVVWLSTSTSSLAYQLCVKPYLARPTASPAAGQDTLPPPGAAAANSQGTKKRFKQSSTKLPDTLAADMRRVQELIANCNWADAPPTVGLVKKLQKLLDAERKKGTIRAPLVVVLEKDALDPRRNCIGIKLLRS
eukprot:COSAG02_NODE_2924_length_7735_cov_4.298324_7_plen_426_part_00